MKIVVIGAGLAGAATAHALATLGCQVTVLEANGPSSHLNSHSTAPSVGLPVGLMAPHHLAAGKAPSALSELSQLGVKATTQAAQALLRQGQDWSPCGALQRASKLGPQAKWFADAAWVKPSALAAAWLAHPLITLHSAASVQRLQRIQTNTTAWQALDASGALLAQGDAVVLANAYQAKALQGIALQNGTSRALNADLASLPVHQVTGQVIYGPWTAQWQALWPQLLPELRSHTAQTSPCAINGNGHFIPAIDWQGQTIWLSGSTYEHDAPAPEVTAQGMAANLQRLQQLIPAATDLLAAQYGAGQLQGWAGARCTTRDRLPLVGAVSATMQPGLYVCTAMGSRGLSFAAICGQHLAGHITGTSELLSGHLAQAVSPRRFE